MGFELELIGPTCVHVHAHITTQKDEPLELDLIFCFIHICPTGRLSCSYCVLSWRGCKLTGWMEVVEFRAL